MKLLIDAIAAHSPAGTNYLNTAFATFSSTYPNPAGLARDEYLAQVVPKSVFLNDVKTNYTNWASNLGDQLSQADMLGMLSKYYPECEFETCIWDKVDDGTLAFDSAHLINYTRDYYWSYLMEVLYENNKDTFTYNAAYTRPKVIADLFETWRLPLATFMDEVETHFDLATRNALDVDTIKKAQYLWVNEWNMYGSSRLGIYQAFDDTVQGVIRSYDHRVSNDTVSTAYFAIDTLRYNKFMNDSIHYLHKGRKRYEGVNHLGNVLVAYTDKRIKVCTNDTIHYYRADVVNAYEYSPFGALMPDRKWDSDTTLKYRFGFNGMEKTDEVYGEGNEYTTELRQYNSSLGRWFSIDPLASEFPWQSPYVGLDNSPIILIDPKGGNTIDSQIKHDDESIVDGNDESLDQTQANSNGRCDGDPKCPTHVSNPNKLKKKFSFFSLFKSETSYQLSTEFRGSVTLDPINEETPGGTLTVSLSVPNVANGQRVALRYDAYGEADLLTLRDQNNNLISGWNQTTIVNKGTVPLPLNVNRLNIVISPRNAASTTSGYNVRLVLLPRQFIYKRKRARLLWGLIKIPYGSVTRLSANNDVGDKMINGNGNRRAYNRQNPKARKSFFRRKYRKR